MAAAHMFLERKSNLAPPRSAQTSLLVFLAVVGALAIHLFLYDAVASRSVTIGRIASPLYAPSVALMTAIFTPEQVARAVEALDGGAPACVSVFAGRLADFGIDYRPIVQDAIARARKTRNVEIIWASTREVFNVIEADDMGCHIITAPADVLKKLPSIGTKSATELSLGAVKSFRDDAVAAGLRLAVPASRAAE